MAWGRRASGEPPRRRVREGLRVSPNEERYLLAEAHGAQVYSVPAIVRLRGPIDIEALISAVQATCDRHEVRRTGYERAPDGTFTKYVEDRATYRLKRLTLPDASDAEIVRIVNDHCLRPCDLTPGEMHRYVLIKQGEQDYVLGFSHHHATSDATAMSAFSMEVVARLLGMPVPDEEAPAYSALFVEDWTRSEAYLEGRRFWTERLEGLKDAGAWPEDSRAAEDPFRPGVELDLRPETVALTQAAAQAIGVTHFSFFYAVWMVLLARMTGQARVCTTFQSAGRKSVTGSDAVQGVFSNALILATEVDERESIASLAQRMRVEVREAIRHEAFPYHHVIRATGLHPRFAINWLPEIAEVKLDQVEILPFRVNQNQDDDDLNLRFSTYKGEVRFVLFYKGSAFTAPRVRAVLEQLVALAEAFARDITAPVGSVRSADLAAPGLLPDPAAPLPQGGRELIHTRFLARAAEAPDAVALRQDGRTWTYGDLERRSAALAARLRAGGVAAERPVAILAERGPELIWSMLAAARLGAPFVVFDSAYPEARLAQFAETCRPQALVRAGGAALAPLAERLALAHGVALFDADLSPEALADPSREGLDAARPTDPAYLLFTSGSTGRPKGVAASHQPLAHFTAWQAAEYGLTSADRFTLLSGLSHDPLLRDVFTPLSLGAVLELPPRDATATPGVLAEWLARCGATVAHLTPAMGLLIAEGARRPQASALRRVFWGGDMLTPQVLDAFRPLAPGAAHVNFYGATETPQAAAAFAIEGDPDWRAAPVGQGTEGFQLLVLDAAGRQLGVGETGEVAVRSNWLSLGYLEQGRIIAPGDRLPDADGRPTIYRTGDRGLYLPDGSVMLVGRADDQVKVHGARVDLSEVTAALAAASGARQAAAIAVGEGPDVAIVGVLSGGRGGPAAEAELRTALAARLPPYMRPARLVWLDALPLSPNGKLDRDALKARLAAAETKPAPPVRTSAVERDLIERWSGILGAKGVTPTASFAGLGGDSLSYVQAYMAAEEVVGELPPGWPLMTISELAALGRPARAGWGLVDTSVLIRALAILAVVVGHFRVSSQYVGVTTGLMLVSGFMFGGLGLREVFARRSAAPVLRVVRNIFVPTAILSLALWLYRSPGMPPEPYILFFTADLQNYERLGNAQDLYLWFVHALLHVLLMIWLAVLGLKAADKFEIGPKRFLAGLFAAGCLTRFGLPWFLDPGFYAYGVHHLQMIYFLPTTHLPTVVLGAMVVLAEGRRERVTLAGITLAYGAATAWCYGFGNAAFVTGGALLLLAVPRVRVPQRLSPVLMALAGASLWIYLTHMMLRDAIRAVIGPHLQPLGVLISVGGGIAVWVLWTRAAAALRRAFGRPEPTVVDVAV